jgi:hypothetical protein
MPLAALIWGEGVAVAAAFTVAVFTLTAKRGGKRQQGASFVPPTDWGAPRTPD